MNKTERLNALGTSCLLLVQNPHCNNDSNSHVLLLQSSVLCIKLHKGKLELLFHDSYYHNVQEERAFGADIIGIPFLLSRVGYMARSHSPVITALPQESDKKREEFCLLPTTCAICEALGRHLTLA